MKERFKTNMIYNMDCLEGLKQMPDNCIDIVVCDPPYIASSAKSKKGKTTGVLKNSAYMKEIDPLCDGFDLAILDECMRVLKNANIFLFCSKAQIPTYVEYFNKFGLNMRLLTWHKTNSIPTCNGKYLSDSEYIFYAYDDEVAEKHHLSTDHFISTRVHSNRKSALYHPTIKPLDIIRTLIESASNEGDAVLDPFMGSGTTAVGCIETGRNFCGYELAPKYFDVANTRISMALEEHPEFQNISTYLGNTEVVSSVDKIEEPLTLACIDVSDKDVIPYEFIESITAKMPKPNLYITLSAEQILEAITYFSDRKYKYDIISNYQHDSTKHVLFLRKGGVKLYGDYHSKRKWFVDDRVSVLDGLPYTLMCNLITNSTQEGETVFLSGTYETGIEVCLREKRKFVVYEPDTNIVQECFDTIDKISMEISHDEFSKAS